MYNADIPSYGFHVLGVRGTLITLGGFDNIWGPSMASGFWSLNYLCTLPILLLEILVGRVGDPLWMIEE